MGEGVRRTGEGFTLAEVLITLAIIGVVAAITLPALITNIQDRVKEKRVQNIQQKFSKATDKMLSISGLNGYESTLDFVNELKNHLSIAKICENDELRNCWPTEKVVIDDDGTEWEISKTTTGDALRMKDDNNHKWDDTVGIITGDGTSMILSYNTKCDIDPTKTTVWTSDKSNSTNCIAAVFDWNGSSKPNKFGGGDVKRKADVFALNANGLGHACVMRVNGRCYGTPFIATPASRAECEAAKSGFGVKYCYDFDDYWFGGLLQCGGPSKVATASDLINIASQLYVGNPKINSSGETNGLTYIDGTATALGFPEPRGIFFFMNYAGHQEHAHVRYFNSWNTGTNQYRRDDAGYTVCILD